MDMDRMDTDSNYFQQFSHVNSEIVNLLLELSKNIYVHNTHIQYPLKITAQELHAPIQRQKNTYPLGSQVGLNPVWLGRVS